MDEKIIEKWLEISYGSGYGSGYGNGDGQGSGYGSGNGDGQGCNIKCFNKKRVWKIDNVNTIITSIHNNIAKGFILSGDFSLEKTYIIKGHNYFAHGETIREAMQSLEEKIFDDINIEDKIAEFKNKFAKNKKYSGHDFFIWHHNLTGSCLQGRKLFVEDKNVDLDKMYSVSEFLQIVKGAYGWNILEQLVDYYKEEKENE